MASASTPWSFISRRHMSSGGLYFEFRGSCPPSGCSPSCSRSTATASPGGSPRFCCGSPRRRSGRFSPWSIRRGSWAGAGRSRATSPTGTPRPGMTAREPSALSSGNPSSSVPGSVSASSPCLCRRAPCRTPGACPPWIPPSGSARRRPSGSTPRRGSSNERAPSEFPFAKAANRH